MKTNWKKLKLKKVLKSIKTGKTPPTKNEAYFGDEINWYTPSDLDKGNLLGDSSRKITQLAIDDNKGVIFPVRSVLVGCIGNIGKVGYIESEASSNQQITALIPDESKIYYKYLYYWVVRSEKLLQSKANNAVVPILNNTRLKEIEIPLPPLDIQKKIADALDKADKIRRKRQETVEKLDELVQSVFLDMFGDPVKNEKGWEITSLADYGNFKNGLNYSKSESGNEILTLGVGDFKDKSVLNDTNMLQKLNLNEVPSEGYFLKDGDIVFVRSNGNRELVGRSMAVYPGKEKVTYSGFCIRYRIENELYEPLFLTYLFKNKHFKKSMLKNGRGANIQNINQKLLSALKVPTPPMKDQSAFVDRVKRIRDIRISQNSTLRYTNNLFNSLMQKAFKGELEFN